MEYGFVSPPLAVNGGTFTTSGLNFGVLAGTVAVDWIDSAHGDGFHDFSTLLVANNAGAGSITDLGGLQRQLTLPISIPFAFDFGAGVMPGTMSGQIVAFALVPEPSTLVLASLGAVVFALGIFRRRRKSTGKAGD